MTNHIYREAPKKMSSTITETDSALSIETPKKKSWAIVVLLSILTLQFTNAVVQVLFFDDAVFDGDMPLPVKAIILIISLTALYFIVKGLLWQLKGVKRITVSSGELAFTKTSPLSSKTSIYQAADIRSLDVKNETVAEGPFAMLQLLGITDRIKVTFAYGYKTVTLISGVDVTEATELKQKIESRLGAGIEPLAP